MAVSSSRITERPAVTGRRRPPLLIGLVLIAVVLAGYLGWQHWTQRPHVAAEPASPVPVIAAKVQKQNFPIVLTGIGNVTALNSATVRSMVTEQIVSIDFKDGQFVKKGELLAQLDPSTYQAQLDQAEANLARDQAHLENGRINLGRYVPLAKQGFAPQQQVATQQAMIAQEEATIKRRSGGDRICQDRAELYQTGGAVRRGRRNSPARCRQHHSLEHDTGFSERAECSGGHQPSRSRSA